MHYSWHVLDWRRQIADIYAEVRATPDPAEAHARWAERRGHLLATHPATPVPAEHRDGFTPVVAPYDPAFRFEVSVTAADAERREVPTATDGVVPFERIGRVELGDLGGLDVWWLDSYGGGVFVPLKDTSPGSYGGGRYLLDTVKGADLGGDTDALVVDLNFAFQPSCAYSSDWVCPLPGPGNRLDVPIEVGERYVSLA